VKVFVSYRRADVGGYAGRLNDALAARLGADMVFQDVAAIGAGRDFIQEIDHALAEADAVVAVIGPGWLQASSADGERRLVQPDDFVRTELVRGLASGLPVVPVLVGGAALPMAAELPAELSRLVDRQAVIIRDEAFHDDVDRLISSLRGGPSREGARHRGRLIALITAVVVIVGAGVLTWVFQGRTSSDATGSTPGLGSCQDPVTPDWNQVAVDGKPSAVLSDTRGSVTITINAATFRPTESGDWLLELTAQMQNGTAEDLYLGSWYYRAVEVAQRAFDPACFDFSGKSVGPGEVVDGVVGFTVACRPDRSVAVVLESSTTPERVRLPITSGPSSTDCQTGAPP
jgi:TIR domain